MRHPQQIADACHLAAQHLYTKDAAEAVVVLRLLRTLLDENKNARDVCDMHVVRILDSTRYRIEDLVGKSNDGKEFADMRAQLTKLKEIATRAVETNKELDALSITLR